MQIVVCTYTLRFHTFTKEQVIETYKKVNAMGYDGLEGPIGFRHMSVEEDLELLAKYNLKVSDTGGDLKNPDEVITRANQYGVKIVGIPAIPGNMMMSVDGFKAYAEEMNAMIKPYAGSGLKFQYHNHAQEFRNFPELNGKTGFDILVEETDPDSIMFQLDTHWATAGGADPANIIRSKLKNRIPIVHFKDYAIDYKNSDVNLGFVPRRFAEIGRGNLNWPNILEACKEAGTEWYSVEQDQTPVDDFESLKISIDYMRSTLGM